MKLLIEGIGDVVMKHYYNQLSDATRSGRIKALFLWDSRYSRDYPEYHRRLERNRELIEATPGMVVFDKADRPLPLTKLQPDVVLVCSPPETHVRLIRKWVGNRGRQHSSPIIFVEKPLALSARSCYHLRKSIGCRERRVAVIDDFWLLTRTAARTNSSLLSALGAKSGGPWLKSITLYHLEDHSGNDAQFLAKSGNIDARRHGPIELEGRTRLLRGGLIKDLAPHALSHLSRWTDISSARLTSVRAARYRGVDGDPRKPASIPWETVAELRLTARAFYSPKSSEPVQVRIAVGKGIGGVRSLTPWDPLRSVWGDVKVVVLEGLNGTLALFDLRGSLRADRTPTLHIRGRDSQVSLPLVEHPTFAEWLFAHRRTQVDPSIALGLLPSCEITRIIDEAHRRVTELSSLHSYFIGFPGKGTPFLEDALEGAE